MIIFIFQHMPASPECAANESVRWNPNKEYLVLKRLIHDKLLTLFSVGSSRYKLSFLKSDPEDSIFSCQDLLLIFTQNLQCCDAITK